MIIRFDDISGNTDLIHAFEMVDLIKETKLRCIIWFAVSPLYHKMNNGRVFPAEYSAMSDFKLFYTVNDLWLPDQENEVDWVSHGLVHVDHRLLSEGAQEMSILTASSLLKSKTFVPPFNKWNSITADICARNTIFLVRFEDGWKSAEHNKFALDGSNWYLHPWRWKLKDFKEWLEL